VGYFDCGAVCSDIIRAEIWEALRQADLVDTPPPPPKKKRSHLRLIEKSGS